MACNLSMRSVNISASDNDLPSAPHAITDKTLRYAPGSQQEELDRPFNPRRTEKESDDQPQLTLKKLQIVL